MTEENFKQLEAVIKKLEDGKAHPNEVRDAYRLLPVHTSDDIHIQAGELLQVYKILKNDT